MYIDFAKNLLWISVCNQIVEALLQRNVAGIIVLTNKAGEISTSIE